MAKKVKTPSKKTPSKKTPTKKTTVKKTTVKKTTAKKTTAKRKKKVVEEVTEVVVVEDREETPNEIKNREDGLVFAIKIQNCVASVNLFTSINLVSIYQQLIDHDIIIVNYAPEQFPGLILKTKNPKISSLVFSSGKLVITGAKSTEMVHVAVDAVMEILIANGTIITEKPEIIVQNIVASGNFNGKKINLELASMWLDKSMYEPEQFPGLIYRLPTPKTVLLLFQSGNLVCTGAKDEDAVHAAVRKTYEDLEEIEAFDD